MISLSSKYKSPWRGYRSHIFTHQKKHLPAAPIPVGTRYLVSTVAKYTRTVPLFETTVQLAALSQSFIQRSSVSSAKSKAWSTINLWKGRLENLGAKMLDGTRSFMSKRLVAAV